MHIAFWLLRGFALWFRRPTRPTKRAALMLDALKRRKVISERELCKVTGGRNGSGRRAVRELIEEGLVDVFDRQGRRYLRRRPKR